MININCIYIHGPFRCKHSDCKMFLGIFNPQCKLINKPYAACILQEEYEKPAPPKNAPPRKYYNYVIKVE